MRLIGLIFMIALAGMGIGITGAAPILSNKRGEYVDNEIRTEMPAEKEEDASEAEEVQIN